MSRPFHQRGKTPDEGERGGSRLRWLALAGAALLWFWRRRKEGERDGPSREEIERGHRPIDDISEKGVALFGISLALLIALVLGGTALLVSILEGARTGQIEAEVPYAGYTADPNRPQLQSDPAIELKEVREREERLLGQYRWADREAGIVSIPIDRAIAMLADTLGGESERGDSLLVLTESGYVYRAIGAGEPESPPFLGRSPEPYTVNPDLAEILRYVDVMPDSPSVPPGRLDEVLPE